MIISTQIVTVWVLTLFLAYLAGREENYDTECNVF